MHKDEDNITYLADVEKVYSEKGKEFHREKYFPKLDRVKKYLKPEAKYALDVGVGYGSFSILTKEELGLEIYGMDPFPKSIEIAGRYSTADLRLGKIEDNFWPFEHSFDFISCLDVVEHLEDPGLFYVNSKKYLAPDGIVLISTPLRLFPYEMRKWPFIGIPDKNETHINVHPPEYWDLLAASKGFEILESWRGEHLTHVKIISGALRRISTWFGINPRTAPVISSFQQAYNQILKLK